MTAFEEMGIMAEMAKAVETMDWMLPTDIQSEAIPLILGGGDVLMAAETGSGKTGAFCLPILQIVWETIYDTHSDRKKISGTNASPKWQLSATDREVNLSLSADGMSAQSKGDQRWQGCRTNCGVKRDPNSKSNRFYFEVQFTDAGLARVGWSLANANLELGFDKKSWGYGGTAKKSTDKNFESYGQPFGEKFDVIGNVIDLDTNTISWTKNGQDLGIAFKLPKPLCEQNVFYPSICVKNAGVSLKFSGEPNCANALWVGNANQNQISTKVSEMSSSKSKASSVGPKALIVEPSRELAQQTYDCITGFKRYLSGEVKQALLVGGVSARDQMDQLSAGVDIVVGTPGRIDELINSGHLSLDSCRFFVVDEVDALLQQGNQNLLIRWHSLLPRMFSDGKRLQMIVCSATLHNFDVKNLANKLMFFPTWVDLKGEDSVPETVHHVVFRIDPRKDSKWKSLQITYKTDGVHNNDSLNSNQPNKETLSEALKMLKGYYVVKAIDALNIDQAIIFCRTKLDCDNLENYFNDIGKGGARNAINRYSCVCLHSDRKAFERTENLNKFKQRKCNFLICTDVAARGIDIKGIPFVIQVTLPDEKSNYLHRIGRVGRAERMGLAVSLVSEVPEKVWYHSNCNTRGKGCYNTRLVEEGGCCMWYNELQILSEIEENLNCIIQSIESDFKLQVNEFDGKVTYGSKSTGTGYTYEDHVKQMAEEVSKLSQLETSAQNSFLKFYF